MPGKDTRVQNSDNGVSNGVRKILSTTLVLLALATFMGGSAPTVHAQLVEEPPGSEQLPPTGGDDGLVQEPPPSSSGANTPTNTLPSNPDAKGDGLAGIMQWIALLFAWLLGVAAVTLDYAVHYTVVTMGTYVNNLDAIGVTWRVMRDFGNIILIFGFLAIGITTILNVTVYGWGRKALPMLLVAAVFLNFSLFFTKAVIDTGNLFATQFYTQINGGALSGAKQYSDVKNEGLSNKIMGQVGLQTIYNQGSYNPDVYKAANSWIVGFMAILLFLVASFVMFALAFILIARFVMLLFLIIISPIGIAGWAIPKLSDASHWWFDRLIKQTMTAPVLLLMLYVALAVITDARFLTGFGLKDAAAAQSAWMGFFTKGGLESFASLMLSFMVAMGLLLFVVVLSNKISAWGGGWATRTAAKLSFGATAWAGRTTVGWASTKTARGLRKTWVARVPIAGTGLIRGLEGVGKSSFDARGTKVFGGLGALNMGDLGKAQTGGYKKDLEERVKRRTDYAKDLKGRELTDDEKMRRAAFQYEIEQIKKGTKLDEARRARDIAAGSPVDPEVARRLKEANEEIKKHEKEIESIDSVTDKGAQRKYAKVLLAGMDQKDVFNKYINFAANTEGAKKILDAAKESENDKALNTIKKAMKKAEEEEGAAPAAGAAAGAAPGAGGAGGAPGAGGAAAP